MADRSLRGMRIGAQSLQSEIGVEYSPRRTVQYQAVDGARFDVVFAADAEIPEEWESPRSGLAGRRVGEDGAPIELDERETKTARTHWDMLLERRTRAELEELLEERLQYLRARRGQTNDRGRRQSA